MFTRAYVYLYYIHLYTATYILLILVIYYTFILLQSIISIYYTILVYPALLTLLYTLYCYILTLLYAFIYVYLYSGIDLMLVSKLSSAIHLVHPLTGVKVDVSSVKYFTKPLSIILATSHLTKFVVLDITLLHTNYSSTGSSGSGAGGGQGDVSQTLAEAVVCRERDFGENDVTYTVLTHLGAILKPGDAVLGYDLEHTVVDDELLERLPYDRPDIILVSKSYGDKQKKPKAKRPRRGRPQKTAETTTIGHNSEEDLVESLAEVDLAATSTSLSVASAEGKRAKSSTGKQVKSEAESWELVGSLLGNGVDEESRERYLQLLESTAEEEEEDDHGCDDEEDERGDAEDGGALLGADDDEGEEGESEYVDVKVSESALPSEV